MAGSFWSTFASHASRLALTHHGLQDAFLLAEECVQLTNLASHGKCILHDAAEVLNTSTD